eukprot:CAMPEP_0178447840 /NCGR_PEP_ID=MMETSP0689_2-20121128/41645_1 /TAXON_ID=160604 /ORGANISM="Amphidinium massartii, Strain CS-259" /LENGTH=213 /DNA_ID=CAMNT_0020072945 /DNA_START=492 /DNA_END=1133 /DNA_ORIENTATION=+
MSLTSETEQLALPFLAPPKYKNFAANAPGDAGFDPLGLCTDPIKFVLVRDLELRNGRLAMLAAVAWPLSEFAYPVAQEFGFVPALEGTGGGSTAAVAVVTAQTSTFAFWGCLLTGVYMGVSTLAQTAAKSSSPSTLFDDMVKGEGLYDPLKLQQLEPKWCHALVEDFGWMPQGRKWMPEAELKHSRLAMVVMVLYFFEELTTRAPLLSFTSSI